MTCVLVRNNTVLMNPPGKNGSVKRIFIIRGALYPLKLGSWRLKVDIKVNYGSEDRVGRLIGRRARLDVYGRANLLNSVYNY